MTIMMQSFTYARTSIKALISHDFAKIVNFLEKKPPYCRSAFSYKLNFAA